MSLLLRGHKNWIPSQLTALIFNCAHIYNPFGRKNVKKSEGVFDLHPLRGMETAQLLPVPSSFPWHCTAHLGNMKNRVESIPPNYSGGVRLLVRWEVIEILWLHFLSY